jgi:hypothetical protein
MVFLNDVINFDRPRILHRFYACLRSQQEFGKIRRFFKQMEITAQLGACEAELESVLDSFKVCSDIFGLLPRR